MATAVKDEPTIAEGGKISTYDKIVGAQAASANLSLATNMFQAYSSGQMSPDDAQAYEAHVNAGDIMLPRGATLKGAQDAAPAQKASRELPLSVWKAYGNKDMTLEDRIALEEHVKAGDVKQPVNFVMSKTEKPGFLGSLKEMVTGEERSTTRTQAADDWVSLPEIGMNSGGIKTVLGSLSPTTPPAEIAQIIKANFPNVGISQDAKGNYLLRSNVDGKEYAVKPGFQLSDVPRAAFAAAQAIPAGRAATIAGRALGFAGMEAANQAVQAGAGGEFNVAPIVEAGVAAPAMELAGKGLSYLGGKAAQSVRGAAPAVAEAPAIAPAAAEAAASAAVPQAAPKPRHATPAVPSASVPMSSAEAETLADKIVSLGHAQRGEITSKEAETLADKIVAMGRAARGERPAAPALPGASAPITSQEAESLASKVIDLGRSTRGEVTSSEAEALADQVILMARRARSPKPSPLPQEAQAAAPAAAVPPTAPVVAADLAAAPVVPAAAAPPAVVPPTAASPAPKAAPSPAATAAAQPAAEYMSAQEMGTLVRTASGSGPGAQAAKERLAAISRINPEARAAADRHGFELPSDVFSDNPQVRSAAGLTRSEKQSGAEAMWRDTARAAVEKADEVVRKFDAMIGEHGPEVGAISDNVRESLRSTRQSMETQAKGLYDKVDQAIQKATVIETTKLKDELEKTMVEVGESLTGHERDLINRVDKGDVTYGALLRMKTQIGEALSGKVSNNPWGSMDTASLKRLYGALAEDQVRAVETHGSPELVTQLKAANLLTAQRKKLEDRMVNAFGKEHDGSIGALMRGAIESAKKGDSSGFTKLLKVIKDVPPEMQREVLGTALASVTRATSGAEKGNFGFTQYAEVYKGLRSNAPVFTEVARIMGPERTAAMRDLYVISKRVSSAMAEVSQTGKANQELLRAMKGEGLVSKVLESTFARGAITALAALKLGPLSAGVTPMLMNAIANGRKQAVVAAGNMFHNSEFQELCIQAATKSEVSPQAVKAVARSQAFSKFANAVGISRAMNERERWIMAALESVRPHQERK